MKKLFISLAVWSMFFSLILVTSVSADSTIGTNMSTTGTFTVNKSDAAAIKFQNGSGTNLFIFDTANTRFGTNSGTALDTKFEVGGTASATNLMVSGAVQLAGNVSVAYSRFGTTTTNHANYISASNDLLVSGDVEIRGSASFGGTASVSGIFYMNDGRHRPNANSATAFRFQNTAGTTDVLTIDTTNTRVGVNAGGAVDTTFEVGGAASISGNVFFGSKASISSNLQISGRFIADTVASHSFRGDLNVTRALSVGSINYQNTTFEVGGTASIGTDFNVGEKSTATTSVTFETKGSAKGVCFIITGNDGTVYYARITASGGGKWWITTVNCNQ